MNELDELLELVRTDAAFRERLRHDPASVLHDVELTADDLRILDVALRTQLATSTTPVDPRSTGDRWVVPGPAADPTSEQRE